MKKKLLIIEPHSDDAMFAAGGYFLKLKQSNEFEFYFALINASDITMNHATVTRTQRIAEYQNYVDYFDGTFLRPEVDEFKLPIDFDSKLDTFPIAKLIKLIENTLHI